MLTEIQRLEARLAEAEETLRAIREGEVDAVVVSGRHGEQVFSLTGAEAVYRQIVETMTEAALTVSLEGTVLFANKQFTEMLGRAAEQVIGHPLSEFVAAESQAAAEALLVIGREQAVRQRLAFQGDDGGTVPAHVSAHLLPQDGEQSLCIVATDLTELEDSAEVIQQLRRQQEALRLGKELSDALNRINKVVHSTLDFDEVVQRLVAEGAGALGSETAALSLRQADGWTVSRVHGLPAELVGVRLTDDQERHTLLAIQSGQIVTVGDAFNDERFNREHFRRHDIRAVLVAPLIVHGKPLGALFFNYHSGPRVFSDLEVNFARQLAATASVALDNAGLFEDLHRSEDALQASQERLAVATSATGIGMFEWDVAGGKVHWTQTHEALFGYGSPVSTTTTTAAAAAAEHDYRYWADRVHPDDLASVEGEARRAMEDGGPLEVEYRIVWPDGRLRWIDTRGIIVPGSDSVPERMLGVAMDITGRKETEAALHESEQRYRLLFDRNPDGVFAVDPTGRFILANSACEEICGYSVDELRQTTFMDLCAPDQREHTLAEFHRGLTQQTYNEMETALIHKDGHRVELWIAGEPVAADGKVVAMHCTAKDITERKHAEEALRDALAKAEAGDRMLSSLMASVPEGITICDAAGNLRMVSRHGQELLGEHEGRSIEEVARRSTVYRPDGQTVMPTDEFPLIRALAGEVVQNLELLQISASGRKLPLLCNAAPIRDAAGQTVGAIVAWRDITEQRKAEEALHKVNRSLNALGHSSRAMNRATDEASYLEEVCRIVVEDCGRAMVWIGYAEDDEARTVRPVAHSGFEEGYLETLRVTWADTERGRGPTGTAVRTGRPVICRNMLTDPRFAPWRQEALKRGYASSIAIPLVADGKAFGAIAFYARESDPFVDEEVQLLSELASDLAYGIMSLRLRAAHARAEEALRESEARFRSAFDDGAIAMALTSTDFHMMQVNPAFCRLLGYSRKELVGHSFLEFTHPEDQERNAARIQNLLTGKARTCRMEKRYLRKDGTVVWADMSTASVCDAAGKPLYIVTHIQDITERKRAEDALRQAKKELEVRVRERTAELDLRARQLARLTLELTMAEQRERQHLAQVLHDGLQQLLVAAKFRLNVLESAQDERVRQEAVELGELLTDSIVTSRLLTAELSPPVLKSGLVPSLEWLTRWVEDKHGLKVELDTPVNLAPLAENVTILLFQASRELLFNVVKHAGVKSARLTVASDDHHVVIAVEDRGRGFDPEWRSRTASSMGGLGLFAIGERIELLGGCLDIGSVPGGGSRVTMTVPFMPEATRPAEAQPQRRASVGFASPATAATDDGQGRLRIVLVDDHAVVRQGLATLLRKETQFQIVGEASDGKSAVELVRQLQPDVVLMDISMPGMDGVEATRIIHEEHPEVRIIGLSIHDDAHAGDEICRAGAAAYLSKSGPVDAIVQTVLACCGEGK